MNPAPCDIHTSARPNAFPTPACHDVNAALRAEALRQLHWQRREWERRLTAHPPGPPCLIAPAHRAGLSSSLDLLREAGEDIPPWLYQRGSTVRTTNLPRGATGTVRLDNLLADIVRVLAWIDSEPSALVQGVSHVQAAKDGLDKAVKGVTA